MSEPKDGDKKIVLHGLANCLVTEGLLTEEAAAEAAQKAKSANKPLVSYIVEQSILSAKEIAYSTANHFGLPVFDIDAIDRDILPHDLISDKLIIKDHALPLIKRGRHLFVAVSDVANIQSLTEFGFQSGLHTHAIIVEEDKLSNLIDEYLNNHDSEESLGDLSDSGLDELDIQDGDELEEDDDEGADVDDAPIVRFVNKILLDAIKQGASDLHFEPYESLYRIRFRVDGVLQEVANPPINLASRITARIKVVSKLDISERRVPQDGHFRMKLSKKRSIDFRVSTCPTVGGEKVVMRILDPSNSKVGIDALGYEDFQKDLFIEAIHRPQGMVLVTGPTGSGKTVSLYTALNILNTAERNISTAEDPVELNLNGINQVHVNPKTGLTFASALKSFLRQDPDIIMVGEIRDYETGSIAIKAAQTGHLVLSTLHTNSAPETLTRMVNMGVERFNIATSVTLIIAQRLARRLCSHCKIKAEIPKEILLEEGFIESDLADGFEIFGPSDGCKLCIKGYKGRVGLYEVLKMSETIGRIIMDGGNSINILDQAMQEGMQPLRRSGIRKVLMGLTSVEEVVRVTSD